MVHLRFAGLVLAALWTLSCTPPPPPAPSVPEAVIEGEVDPEALSDLPPEGGAGGSGSDDPTPAQLTGLPGIDRAQELEIRILDARGNGRLGEGPYPRGRVRPSPRASGCFPRTGLSTRSPFGAACSPTASSDSTTEAPSSWKNR